MTKNEYVFSITATDVVSLPFSGIPLPLFYWIPDELCRKIQPNAGLSLSVKNKNGQLRPLEKVAIDVTAFANCWGVYFDHIVIRIPELPPAIIPVLVVVEGPPVWFTMSPPLRFKAPRQEPLIR